MSLENDHLTNREQAHKLFTKNRVFISHGSSPTQIATDYLLKLGVRPDIVYTLFSKDSGWKYEVDVSGVEDQPTDILINYLMDKTEIVYETAQQSLNGINWFGFNDHGPIHIHKVLEAVRGLGNALDLPDNTRKKADITAVGHDLGNLISRDIHSLISPLILRLVFPGLRLEAAEFNSIRRAIELHDSLIYLKILKGLEPYDRQELTNRIVNLFGKEALLLILADKADIGPHRVNPKALNPLGIDAHSHSEYNLLFQTTKLAYDATGETFEWDIDFNPEVRDVSEFKDISIANQQSSTGKVFYSSKRTRVIENDQPVAEFRKSVDLFVSKYSDKIKMALLASLALNTNTNSAKISFISRLHNFEQSSIEFIVNLDTLRYDLNKIRA